MLLLGHTATDGNGFTSERPPEQGAAIAVRMATLGPDSPSGVFVVDDGPIAARPSFTLVGAVQVEARGERNARAGFSRPLYGG